jgi:DNA-directed RNA polymerase subunit RPC12/RpoP
MSTAPTPKARPQDKFSLDRSTIGGITFLELHGTLNEGFEGRKVADSIRTKKLVVSLRDVRRFASWGMSEWMDFLRISAERDLYLVECSTYALSQINLVTGLLGHAKLVSFYASYRCGSCGEERETLFLVPSDRETIRDLPNTQQECATCGRRARIEEYPAAFFEKIADRPSFDIDDEVLAFLGSRLGYALTPDLTRFRAFRRVHKGYTYLRLSGNLGTLPSDVLAAASEGTTVADLSGIVFHPAEMAGWQAYVQAALARVRSLQLLNCPPAFLENAMTPDDLRDKLKIRTLAILYDCLRCETTTPYMVDVAENLELLVAGTAPTAACPSCGSALVANLTPDQALFMRYLPARDRDAALDKFLAAACNEPQDKLENCLVAPPPKPLEAPGGSRRTLYVALGLGLLIVGGVVVVALGLRKQDPAPATAAKDQPAVAAPSSPPPKTFERPEWIISDAPSSAYCHDLINRLMCVGVSAYRPTRDEAVAEANDAALEELVSAVGLKISEPFFRESVIAGYSGVRSKALTALQAADLERASPEDLAAADVVAKGRKRVVEILRGSGGAAVPTQRTDWYWEEYAAKKGGTEALVFIRYDVSLDAIKALVEKYSATTQLLGSTAVTAFPGLAWQYGDFTGGAMLTKVARPLADAGVTPQSVIMAVGEYRVGDTINLGKRVDEWKQTTANLKLMVRSPDKPARVVEIQRALIR